MATLTEWRTIVETAYTDRARPYVVSRQNAYFANHGRYWQGLWTRDTGAIPQDPEELPPTIGTATPSDIDQPWPAEVLAQNFPMIVKIDAYVSPGGPGYVGTVATRWNGQIWTRSLVFGPATWLARPWQRTYLDGLP